MNTIKFATISPQVFVADPIANARMIITETKEAAFNGASIIVFPELSLCGVTCGSLLSHNTLIDSCNDALDMIKHESKNLDCCIIISYPKINDIGEALVLASVIYKGEIIAGQVYGEEPCLFTLDNLGSLTCAITYDFKPCNADIVFNLCDGKGHIYSRIECGNAATTLSKNGSAVITASSGSGESTNDYISTGYKSIAQGGRIYTEGEAKDSNALYYDLDMGDIINKTTHLPEYIELGFDAKMPYMPKNNMDTYIKEAFYMQVAALADRMSKIGVEKAVVGISGGLDSTLALLVTHAAFEELEIDSRNIIAVTMPCFGTSTKTRNLALRLMKLLNVTTREIDISEAVTDHLNLIGHDLNVKNVTYENAQARERTQVLMDIANDVGGIVIGTGDMSEAALGFCTYGGDALSMYNVNAGVPKTLVRLIVNNIADNIDETISKLLKEILELPISPELINSGNGITQKTEEIIGPYILHDYIMYYFLKGETPTDIFEHAIVDFEDDYDSDTIIKTLKTFYIRFFSNQFKREAMPDGPQIIDVSLSVRDGFNMPSDISGKIWIEEIERL